MSGENLGKGSSEPNPQAEAWGALTNADNPDALSQEDTEALLNATKKVEDANKESNDAEKSFTQKELERIAKATGRPVDDEEVLKLNLVLRYKEFKKLKDLYENNKENGTMTQRGTLEDIATAKRELEEAMYLYDPSFEEADNEVNRLNAEQKAKNEDKRDIYEAKDSANRAAYNRQDKKGHNGRSWVKERMARNARYNDARAKTAEKRNNKAEALHFNLYTLAKGMEKTEIFQTYELNKDESQIQPLKARRNGVKDYYKEANGINNFDVNFKLYPHAPEEAPAKVGPDPVEKVEPTEPKPTEPEPEPTPTPAPEPEPEPEPAPGPKEDEPNNNPDNPENPENPEDNPDNTNPVDPNTTDQEELKKLELEELKRKELEEEYKKQLEKQIALQKEIEELEKNPLVAVNADFTEDRMELAHDLAENAVNEEVAKSKLIGRLWKGTLFKKYFVKKYEREFLDGDRKSQDGEEEYTVDELIAKRSKSAIKRFVLSATEGMAYIHEKAGEKRTEADAETTAAIKGAIEKFATAEIPEGGSLKDLKAAFINEMKQLDDDAKKDGKNPDSLAVRNYLEVAIEARKRAEHGIAIERVMEGFKVYNATVRDNIRTQAHRDSIDKLVNKLESSKIGQFIPAETIAAAFTIASCITNNVGRVAGGLFASAAISGAKESNRIAEDRARMLRDEANGGTYGHEYTEEELNSMKRRQRRQIKKIEKYEAKIGGTRYQIEGAGKLTKDIEDAQAAIAAETENGGQVSEESRQNLLQAIANARLRIEFSDSEAKDLISYSSENQRGEERLNLDIALINAEKALSDDERKQLETTEAVIAKNIVENVDKQDAKFGRTKAFLATKKAGKTLLIGGAIMAGAQELVALISPKSIGAVESGLNRLGITNTQNDIDASETMLSKLFGLNSEYQVQTSAGSVMRDSVEVNGNDTATMEQLEGNGYTKTEIAKGWTETQRSVQEIDASNIPNASKVELRGFADNGTDIPDGAELGLHIRDGQMVSTISENSTMGDQVFEYSKLAAEGKIHGVLNIGGTEIEVLPNGVDASGNLTWGMNGVFTTPSGETIKAIGEDGALLVNRARIVAEVGTNADGITEVVSLATEKSLNNVADSTILQTATQTIDHPAKYLFTKITTVPAEYTNMVRDMSGVFTFAPETARQGLGGVRRAETAPRQPERPTPVVEQLSQEEQGAIDRFLSEQESERAREVGEMMGENPAPALAPAPEPAPAAPEPEPDSGSSDSESASEAQPNSAEAAKEFENQLGTFIEGLRPRIGENGLNFIRDKEGYTDAKDMQYMSWWSGLSENDKNAVKTIYAAINKSPYKKDMTMGRSLGTWLTAAGIISA